MENKKYFSTAQEELYYKQLQGAIRILKELYCCDEQIEEEVVEIQLKAKEFLKQFE